MAGLFLSAICAGMHTDRCCTVLEQLLYSGKQPGLVASCCMNRGGVGASH